MTGAISAPVVGVDVSAIPDDPRGAGRYVIELVAALDRRANIELRLETRRADGDRWQRVAPRSAVAAVVPDGRARRLAWEQVASPRFVDRWGVDVHHGPHYTTPELAKVRKVVTVHDLTFFDHPEWHEKVKVAVFTRAIKAAVRLADAIVCVSAPTARRLQELLDPQCPVHVIPHGIDHDLFSPRGDAATDRALLGPLGVRPPYVAFWGTLEPRKDVATLVAAFDALAADHPDLLLAVAGGSGWGHERFEQAVAASPHADRIVRTGYLDDAALPAFARQAAAVVYAAFEEGFGLPAVEALACGAEAVVTTEGSVMDDLTDGAAWLAPAGEPDALASTLARLLDPSTASERAAKRAHGLEVAAAFTWDGTAAAHEAVYTDVAGRPRRRR
ncbi:MAG TPA: glycosyltransferase family 1 protein [Acidimicrobiales bacterium]|nr:glycosyltransferase family 1 protein [Acidimicrobiales bacterium]